MEISSNELLFLAIGGIIGLLIGASGLLILLAIFSIMFGFFLGYILDVSNIMKQILNKYKKGPI
jgi:hypothetical protein